LKMTVSVSVAASYSTFIRLSSTSPPGSFYTRSRFECRPRGRRQSPHEIPPIAGRKADHALPDLTPGSDDQYLGRRGGDLDRDAFRNAAPCELSRGVRRYDDPRRAHARR